jgi:hypothetical protein
MLRPRSIVSLTTVFRAKDALSFWTGSFGGDDVINIIVLVDAICSHASKMALQASASASRSPS